MFIDIIDYLFQKKETQIYTINDCFICNSIRLGLLTLFYIN